MSASRMITGLLGAFGGGTVGRMLGGRTGGMIGSMAGSMLSRGGLGSMLGGLMGKKDDAPEVEVANQATDISHDDAMVLVRAMCSAAKADGRVDESEIERIMGHTDPEDQPALRRELTSPLDLTGLINSVRPGQENEVYAASLMAITVDDPAEVKYLGNLASGLGLSKETVNGIHAELGLV